MSGHADIAIVDCHTHLHDVGSIGQLMAGMERDGLRRLNALSITGYGEEYMAQNLLCALFKATHPGRIYSFAGLHHPPQGCYANAAVYREHAQRMVDLGFDGIKLIEGKPNARKRIGVPLDSEVFDDLYAYLEAERVPVIGHVADAASFWDIDKIPAYAREEGWFYGDGTYPSKEALYGEVEGILRKFPSLTIVFAHFYMMAEEGLTRAGEFLARWPRTQFDITPGVKMYQVFSADPEAWREFFVRFQDRILFGTDNGYSESTEIASNVRRFLETDQEFEAWGTRVRGIRLEREALEKIYHANFESLAGTDPKPLRAEHAMDEVDRMRSRAEGSSAREDILREVDRIVEYFQRLELPGFERGHAHG